METTARTALAPVSRTLNLRETVTEKLRTAIITGELAEGEIVSAPALAAALGVSATPIREAMMDLSREGLVDTLKNKGFRITEVSDKQLEDLTEIRLLLEPPIVARVVGSIPEDGFASLRLLADECLSAAEAEDLATYLVKDRAFHATILAYSTNMQLVDLATSLRSRTRMYGLNALAKERKLSESAREHHTLLDLLAAEDVEGATRLMERHISHVRDLWARGTEDQPPKGETPHGQ